MRRPCKVHGLGQFLLSNHHFSMHNHEARAEAHAARRHAARRHKCTSHASAPPQATKCRRVSIAVLHISCRQHCTPDRTYLAILDDCIKAITIDMILYIKRVQMEQKQLVIH